MLITTPVAQSHSVNKIEHNKGRRERKKKGKPTCPACDMINPCPA
jgi:hypothetical protein